MYFRCKQLLLIPECVTINYGEGQPSPFLKNFNFNLMKTKKVYTDKVYRLKRDAAPLTYMLASHHTRCSAFNIYAGFSSHP